MRRTPLVVLVVVLLLAGSCTSNETEPPDSTAGTSSTTTEPPATTTTVPWQRELKSDNLYVALAWNHHQPLYPKTDEGLFSEPWVRLHAVRDYLAMAVMVSDYPEIQTTFNLSPTLLMQLRELTNGTRDVHWAASAKAASNLTIDERAFVVDRFFDIDAESIDRFDRYRELADKRGERFTDQEITDLQVLWNLAWIDRGLVAEGPLAGLVARGRDFTEADKRVVLDEHVRIVGLVIDTYRGLWDSGQVELTTSSLASPVLPLVAQASLAAKGDPTATMPDRDFAEVPDAIEQVAQGLTVAEATLGRRPVGMWPGGGAVAQLVMSLYSRQDIAWVVSGEQALRPSLDLDVGSFARQPDGVVRDADQLYRPWNADIRRSPDVAMFFGDVELGRLIERGYSTLDAGAAAGDFMRRLEGIGDRLDEQAGSGPHIVTILVDELDTARYDAAGTDRLRTIYRALSRSDTVTTVTPSRYLATFGDQVAPLGEVFPASAESSSFATWIGEDQEAAAWDAMALTRSSLERFARVAPDNDPDVAVATDLMLFAEAGDWFRSFGDDGPARDMDVAFRSALGLIYDALGTLRPAYLSIPIVPEPPALPDQASEADITIVIDNEIDGWGAGARYDLSDPLLAAVHVGTDAGAAYVRVDFVREVLGDESVSFALYIGTASSTERATTLDGQALGFAATHVVEWNGRDPVTVLGPSPLPIEGSDERFATAATSSTAGFDGQTVEFAIPWQSFGDLESGDEVRLRLVSAEAGATNPTVPAPGAALTHTPERRSISPLALVVDPPRDDHGPGTYEVPPSLGSFDLTRFEVGHDGSMLTLTFQLDGPLTNPASSPHGFTDQSFDVYIDTDPGAGTGRRLLLPGRNAALGVGDGWDFAVAFDGWDSSLFIAEGDALAQTRPTFEIAVIPERGTVIARVPLSLLGGSDPMNWGFAAAVLGHDAYAAPDVYRVSDVVVEGDEVRFGGAPEASANHTRIIDFAWPESGVQEASLSAVEPVPFMPFDPARLAILPLLLPETDQDQ